ncbi:hypothetical protein A0J61_06954 [Choanephora cucurbitarum]|uniref:Uncharacterized protein n=1 Tax=Choanephora cucurbitarum TaxID=101091 RepID=A0A1C7N7Q0_9FUNG|nr:hypothetical protein A0J61_06954 [Choanephora cucurbitarum]
MLGCNILTHRGFICMVIALLIVMGPILIAIDLTYLTDWVNSFRIGDFYTYLTFIGIVSLWSIFGFASVFWSPKAFTVYMIGLVIILVIHLILGCIHVILLFTKYQSYLINSCLQRHPSRLFWWDLGFDQSAEMKQIYADCTARWHDFTTERIVSWIVYSVVSFISLFFIVRYQRRLMSQRRQQYDQTDDWSDDDTRYADNDEKARLRSSSITYHEVDFPQQEKPKDQVNSVSVTMHRQRQRLFDEIAKRKRAKKQFIRRRSMNNNKANRNSGLVIHPLDLSQDPEAYHPPPMPERTEEESWNRYHEAVNTLQEDEEAIERQRRLDALSAERMEYEAYRAEEPYVDDTTQMIATENQEDNAEEKEEQENAISNRWSTVYNNNTNKYAPLSTTDQQEEDEEEDKQNQALMDPSSSSNNLLDSTS